MIVNRPALIGWICAAAAVGGIFAAGLGAGQLLQRYDQTTAFDLEMNEIATVLGLRAGMHVGDIRAGAGRWTVGIAHRVAPTGHVYATVGPDPTHRLMQTIAAAGVDNVSVIARMPGDTPRLPIGCCDAVLLRAVYHEFRDRGRLLASVRRNLRKGGALMIIDFDEGTPEHAGGHGVARAIVEREVAAAGFVVRETIEDWNGNAYCVVLGGRP